MFLGDLQHVSSKKVCQSWMRVLHYEVVSRFSIFEAP